MKARVLEESEWGKLDAIPFPQIGPTLPPEDTRVVVVESPEGEIVAAMGVMRVTHLEGLYIVPEHRGNPVLAQELLGLAVEQAKRYGSEWVWATSDTERVDTLIAKVGGEPLVASSFIIRLGDR